MKWFKLDSSFINDSRILELMEKHGHKGLVLYITLLCNMAEQWNGEPIKEFVLNVTSIQRQSGFYHRSIFLQCVDDLCSIFGLSCTNVGLNFHILYPKFLKKQQSYFRGATRGGAFCATGIEQNRIEEKRKYKKKVSVEEKEILEHFNAVCNKSYTLTSSRQRIIKNNLKAGRSISDIKNAITNFSKDTWPDRHKYTDLVYAIGTIRGIDNFEKWINMEHQKRGIEKLYG